MFFVVWTLFLCVYLMAGVFVIKLAWDSIESKKRPDAKKFSTFVTLFLFVVFWPLAVATAIGMNMAEAMRKSVSSSSTKKNTKKNSDTKE